MSPVLTRREGHLSSDSGQVLRALAFNPAEHAGEAHAGASPIRLDQG